MTLMMDHLKNKLFIFDIYNSLPKNYLVGLSKDLNFGSLGFPTVVPLEPDYLSLFSISREKDKWWVVGDYKLGVWDD